MDEIVEAVNSDFAPYFRLVDTSTTIPMNRQGNDTLAVEHFTINRPYGCLIDRGSPVTIVSPSSYIDMGIGNWSFYLALIGGFNYISRETGNRAVSKSYFWHDTPESVPDLSEFIDDLKELLSRPEAWSITTLVASGAPEPEYPTQIHFQIGGKKGDTAMGGDGLFVKDIERYTTLYNSLSERMEKEFGLTSDHQQYHDTSSPRNFLHKGYFANDNNVIIRIEWDKILWSPQRILLAKAFAEEIWDSIIGKHIPSPPSILTVKDIGFEGYSFSQESGG